MVTIEQAVRSVFNEDEAVVMAILEFLLAAGYRGEYSAGGVFTDFEVERVNTGVLPEGVRKLTDMEVHVVLRAKSAVTGAAVSQAGNAVLSEASSFDVCAALLEGANPWEEEGVLGSLSIEQFSEMMLGLDVPLPVLPQKYSEFAAKDRVLGDMLVREGECELVRYISVLLDNPLPTYDRSEMSTSANLIAFLKLLLLLQDAAPKQKQIIVRLDFNRAERGVSCYVTQSETGKSGRVRTDTYLVAEKLTLFFGEDKSEDDELIAAWDDLSIKLRGGLSPVFYSMIPFVPVYAASGNKLQFGRLLADGEVQRAGSPLDWTVSRDRILLVIGLVNLYKLLFALVKLAPREEKRAAVFAPMLRPNDTTIRILPSAVVKTIENCDGFFLRLGTTFETIKEAYKCAKGQPCLVQHSSISYDASKKRGRNSITYRYKVVLTRLGYCIDDINVLSEEDLRAAVRVCLQTCEVFGASGIAHCDLRISNILWGPTPFVADLEAAHMVPWKVPHSSVHFTDWEDGTLNTAGEYTRESDIYQVGVLLQSYNELSDEGTEFAEMLKSKTVSAVDALKVPYLKAKS